MHWGVYVSNFIPHKTQMDKTHKTQKDFWPSFPLIYIFPNFHDENLWEALRDIDGSINFYFNKISVTRFSLLHFISKVTTEKRKLPLITEGCKNTHPRYCCCWCWCWCWCCCCCCCCCCCFVASYLSLDTVIINPSGTIKFKHLNTGIVQRSKIEFHWNSIERQTRHSVSKLCKLCKLC